MKTVFMKSVICEYCNKSFKISGISRHRKACANKSTNQIAMSGQKHTPYYYVDTQFGDRYCLMDGNDMSKKGAYRMLDEIKKVAELTKENELLTRENWEMKRWSVHEELSRLREEKKELVEALREVLKTTLLMPELELKIESLLSKFEVPNT